MQLIIHVGGNCLPDACQLARQAAEHDVAAVAALTPSYFKPRTASELVDFLVPIARAAGDVPFYYYDIPPLTGVHLPLVEVLEIGRTRIPNLAGLKYTNYDLLQLQRCLQLDDGAFEVLFGCDEFLLAGFALGARGAVGSTYNFAAPLYQRIIEAFRRGDLQTAQAEQHRAAEMIEVLRPFGFMSAAKAVMAMIGVDCGPPRLPLPTLTAEQRTALEVRLEELGVLETVVPHVAATRPRRSIVGSP